MVNLHVDAAAYVLVSYYHQWVARALFTTSHISALQIDLIIWMNNKNPKTVACTCQIG